jgi:hypothetical protein
MNETLQELVEFLKTASPVVWEAAMRQVLALGYLNITLGILALILVIACISVLVRLYKECSLFALLKGNFSYAQDRQYQLEHPLLDMKGEAPEVFLWIGVAMGVIIAISFLPIGILRLVNPTWYAIQLLVNSVR